MQPKQTIKLCFTVAILLGVFCLGHSRGVTDHKHSRKVAIVRNSKNNTLLKSVDNRTAPFRFIQNTAEVIGDVALAFKRN